MEQSAEDPFETILHVENQFYLKGYSKAKTDDELCNSADKKAQYDQGFITGKQLGLELGYYSGYIEELKPVLQVIDEYTKHSTKVDQLIMDIEEIVLSINPEEGNVELEELPNTILLLRNKFKTLLLSIGFKKPDFNFSSKKNPAKMQAASDDFFDF